MSRDASGLSRKIVAELARDKLEEETVGKIFI
jgi:hypothetical protein